MDPIREAIDRLNVYSSAVVLGLEANKNLQLLCSVWPTIDIPTIGKRPVPAAPEGLEIPALRDWMWEAYGLDLGPVVRQLKAALGPAFPAAHALSQGIAIMAIFPFGIVNSTADTFVKSQARLILSDLRSGIQGQGGGATP